MSASKVYFTDMRCPVGTGLLDKLKKLIEKAGIDSIDMDSKFVAIKIHFGEPGNLSFLRPNFAKVVADKVTSLGGRPFLTDCNTLYVGRRKHALEHLTAAQENGFSPLSTGCQMIIADGLKGTDEMEVPLEGCDHFQSAFIGRAIMDADIFISLTHFKGHELTGFGGAIKNIGMGCGSRAGKMAMHSIGKPGIDAEKCRGCKTCTHYCAQSAISIGEDHKARIDHDLCAGCGRCIGVCNFDAISNAFDAESTILNERMAEYTKAVIQNRPHFHVSIVNQVSPLLRLPRRERRRRGARHRHVRQLRPRGPGPRLYRRGQRRARHQHQRAGPVRSRAQRPLHRHPSQDQLAQPDRACPEDRHRQRGLRAGDREVRTALAPHPGTAHARQKTASFDAVFFMAFRPAAVRPRKGRLSGRAVFSRRI